MNYEAIAIVVALLLGGIVVTITAEYRADRGKR